MMGGTVWSSDALWNGVTLLNDAAVGVYGMILSAAFCGITVQYFSSRSFGDTG